jgi:hypothetical protein
MKFTIVIPLLTAISPLNRWTIITMKFTIVIPLLTAISPLNRWTICTVMLAIHIPILGASNTLNRWTISTMKFVVVVPALVAFVVNLYGVSDVHMLNTVYQLLMESQGVSLIIWHTSRFNNARCGVLSFL